MAAAFHPYASIRLPASSEEMSHQLSRSPDETVSAATAGALTRVEQALRGWGLQPTALPVVSATTVEPDAIGSVEVRWSGSEEATGWPAMTARLLVLPDQRGNGSHLSLWSRRSFAAELATTRLESVHRLRVVDVVVGSFLLELGERLETDDGRLLRGTVTAARDRRETFVHHVHPLQLDGAEAVHALVGDPQAVRDAGMAGARSELAATLAAGRFRASDLPQVRASVVTDDPDRLLALTWRSDEEATGWPDCTLSLAVEATRDGSRLVVHSHGEPGYDMSRNRVDKRQRDELLRGLGPAVARAVAGDVLPNATPRLVGVA